jgi:hypothetical protein
MGNLGGQSINAHDELQRKLARVTDGSDSLGFKFTTDVRPLEGDLSFNARDECHRDSARVADATILKGRVDAIGFKSQTDVDRDSPLEGAFRLEA